MPAHFSGPLLRDARLASGQTQSGVARKLDVAVLTVWRWEHGEAVPNAAMLPPLTDAVGVEIGDLFADDEQVPA
jgi:transcriptional regulator with XRE-family HTH domain